MDSISGQVIVADTYNNRIRLIDIKSGLVSTLAGSGRREWKDGQGEDASFLCPFGVEVDPMSGQVIVADAGNHRIRVIDIKSGMVSTLTQIHQPRGITLDPFSGGIFVTHSDYQLSLMDSCFTGILEWELDIQKLFLDTSILNPIVDIILMYCNYNRERILSSC